MHTNNVIFFYLHIPPRTPAILQSHRYHQVMPSSSVVFLVEAAASSELIVFVFFFFFSDVSNLIAKLASLYKLPANLFIAHCQVYLIIKNGFT